MTRVGTRDMCFTISAEGRDIATVTVPVPVYMDDGGQPMLMGDSYWFKATLGDGFTDHVKTALNAFAESLEASSGGGR